MPANGGPTTALTGLRGNEIPHWQPVSAVAVTGVSPGQGPSAGGTSVTITGRNFGPGGNGDVRLGAGDERGGHVGHLDHRDEPPGSGTVDVTVTTSRGTSATSSADGSPTN